MRVSWLFVDQKGESVLKCQDSRFKTLGSRLGLRILSLGLMIKIVILTCLVSDPGSGIENQDFFYQETLANTFS